MEPCRMNMVSMEEILLCGKQQQWQAKPHTDQGDVNAYPKQE